MMISLMLSIQKTILHQRQDAHITAWKIYDHDKKWADVAEYDHFESIRLGKINP